MKESKTKIMVAGTNFQKEKKRKETSLSEKDKT